MSSGDRVETRLVGPVQLAASDAAVGSAVASGHVWVVKQIIFTNTTGTDRLIYMNIGTALTGGVTKAFVYGLPIAGNDTIVLDTALVLNANDKFWGNSDTASAVNVTVVGWDKEI
jgi:hypothetical protein